MADNPEWPDNTCKIHLSDGQTIDTTAYQMELAAMMSALQLAKMAFNHQDYPHITIWTDYEAVYKRLTFDDWECPTNSASTSFQ
jgi:ribonuclease HI